MEERKRWYMITTISGKEDDVITALKNRRVSENMENLFEDFKVIKVPYISPAELAKKNNNENFKTTERNLFPGYIFIKMLMTNEAWFIVRNTQNVTGLVGSSGQRTKPTPLTNIEIKKMEDKAASITKEFEEGKVTLPFGEGTLVEIIDGPMKDQKGPIIEVNQERQVAVVELIVFNRKTPTEIEFDKIVPVK